MTTPESPPPHPWERLLVTVPAGGSRVAVASDRMFARIETLEARAAALRHARAGLDVGWGRARWRSVAAPVAPIAASVTEVRVTSAARVDQADQRLDVAASQLQRLASHLRTAAVAYGDAEHRAGQLGRTATDNFAWLLGLSARLYAPMLVTTAFVLVGAARLLPADDRAALGSALQQKLAQNGWLLNNPLTVATLRSAVMGVDDFEEGAAGIPSGEGNAIATANGHPSGLQLSAASIVALLGGVGLLREASVGVEKVGVDDATTPARGLAGRVARIPEQPDTGHQSQIRIDRYRTPGRPDRFEVYVSGTKDFGLTAGAEPFDMTSNISGLAGQSAGSYRAVVAAMKEAGVTASSPVVLNGYSQGGLVTSLVAASGDFHVTAMTTFGSPVGQLAVPHSVSVLTVRHAEDIVPALGGDDSDPHAVVVQRSIFDGQPVPDGKLVAAHELRGYSETAKLVDGSSSAELRGKLDVLERFTTGTDSVQSTVWRAERAAGEPVPGGRANEVR